MDSPSLDLPDVQREPFLTHDDSMFLDEKHMLQQPNPQRGRHCFRRWATTGATHGATFVIALILLTLLPSLSPLAGQHDECPTMWSPIKHAVRYIVDTPSFDYWADDLYSGPPSYESDFAWNDILHPHGFRLNPEEAAKLNISQSIMLPGGDFSSIIGVIHNLHCLRRLRQTIYSDYYYANLTETQRAHNIEHNQHCIESLRTSLMCHPDLTFFPYYWSDNPDHNLNPRPDTQRECVDWEALIPIMRARQYDYKLLDKKTGRIPGITPHNEGFSS